MGTPGDSALVVSAVDTVLSLWPSTVLPGQMGTGLALPPPLLLPSSRSTDACQFQEGWSTGQNPQALGKGSCFNCRLSED